MPVVRDRLDTLAAVLLVVQCLVLDKAAGPPDLVKALEERLGKVASGRRVRTVALGVLATEEAVLMDKEVGELNMMVEQVEH